MATITVDFDGLEDLAPSEVNAGLLCFTEARDRYAREGRAGMAALYNAMAIVLDEVREQRKQAAKNISIHLLDDDGDNDLEWNDDLWTATQE
jgi:hypothetical protein